MAYQWNDVLEGPAPDSLKDLPCDCWVPREGPQEGGWCLLCLACGWYRNIPVEDVAAAQKLSETIEAFIEREEC